MPAITSLDLSNAKLDVDHIADIANSLAPSATDRLGHSKLTVKGAVDTLKAVNPKGNFVTGTPYFIKDVYFYNDVDYLVTIDHTSSTVAADLASGKVVKYQGIVFKQSGTSSVYRTVDDKLQEFFSVRDAGAKGDGTTDDLSSILAAKSNYNYLHFPRVDNVNTTYYFGAITAGQLAGVFVSAENGVTLSFASGEYTYYTGMNFVTDVNVFFRDTSTKYVFSKTPSVMEKKSLPFTNTANKRKRIALDASNTLQVVGKSVSWPTGDAFSIETTTSTTSSMSFQAGTATFKGAFVGLGPYETVSALFNNKNSAGPIGIIVRGKDGFSVVFSSGGSVNYSTNIKNTGVAVTTTIPLSWPGLGQGVYDSFNPENSVWSVSRNSANTVIIKLNGKSLTTPFAPYCGDILEIGFVCYSSTAFTISGFTLEKRTDAIIGNQLLSEIRIFGDSTAAALPGCWADQIKPILDGGFGVKVGAVTNYAVAGTDIGYALNSMNTNGFGEAYYVIIAAGTNNVQGNTPLDQFKVAVDSTLDKVISEGRRPVVVLPWMWYTQAQSGGIGSPSLNYEKAAPYRMVLERSASERQAVLVVTGEELPNPSPTYLSSSSEVHLLRDNIHQDTLSNQLYARSISQAIIDDYCAMAGAVETTLPDSCFKNSAQQLDDFRFTVDKSGMCSFSGTIATPTITEGTTIVEIPRWLRPTRSVNFQAQAISSSGVMLGSCYLSFSKSTGVFNLTRAPASTSVIIVDASPYYVD